MTEAKRKRDYISVVYNEKDKPFTKYPDLLARYLVTRYGLSKGKEILDLGCGRGEFLRGFVRCGLNAFGIDQSQMAKSICSEAKILQSDIGNAPLPFEDNSFDVIFSKSVLEHFYYPEKLVQEIYRILSPSGLVITMVPDWESVYKVFYVDYTHRAPFTLTSLRHIFAIHGFDDVKVEKFRQLPFLWKMPWLKSLSMFIVKVMPRSLCSHSKLIRFSKEVMLLCSAVKPTR